MEYYNTYPYNEYQKQFHLTEEYVLDKMRRQAKYEATTLEEEEEIYQKKLAFIEEIKNQDPHPAKVFAKSPVCFWDTDVYWLHWQKNKLTIIERVIRFFLHGKVSYEEKIQKDLALLEQFYTEEEILDVVGYSTNLFLDIEKRKDIFKHYGKSTRAFKWSLAENITRGKK